MSDPDESGRLAKRIEELKVEAQQGKDVQPAAEREAMDAVALRRLITTTVMVVWGGITLIWAVGLFFAKDAAFTTAMADVVKTSVLPLTTLVLGYYLGRSK